MLATLGQGICRLLQPLSRHTCPFTKLSAHNLSFVKPLLLRLLTSTLHWRAFFESHSKLEQPFRICFLSKKMTSKEILRRENSAAFVIVTEKPNIKWTYNHIWQYIVLLVNFNVNLGDKITIKIIHLCRSVSIYSSFITEWRCRSATFSWRLLPSGILAFSITYLPFLCNCRKRALLELQQNYLLPHSYR